MVKKNYLGGLKVLLLPLFIMLLGMCSTCYARTEINVEEAQYIWDYLFTNKLDLDQVFYYSFGVSQSQPARVNKGTYTQFYNFFNTNNNLDINLNSTLFFMVAENDTTFYIYYGNFNNGKIGNLPYFYFEKEQQNGNSVFGHIYAYDNNLNEKINYSVKKISVSKNSSSWSFNSITDYEITTDGILAVGRFNYKWNQENWSDNIIANNISGLCNFLDTNSIYLNWNGTVTSNEPKPYLLKTLYTGTNNDIIPSPIEPSGDVSGESPSGDSGDSGGNGGGFIDYTNKLDDINNNISNSSNNIIHNNNENTDKIINSISGETNKIINNITNTDTDVNFSGELSNMLSSTANVVDPTVNFFSWLLDNMRTVLNSTGNYNIEVTLFDETYTIRSDFFVLPNGDLKTFLQLSFIGWFGWHVIKKIRYIVYAIQCVKITDALHQVDFNPDIL